jgi:protein-tyrosine phosphatase
MRPDCYRIKGPWQGTLAIVARPRGGDWLEDEVRAWRQAGFDVVVSLLTHDETTDLDITREAELCEVSDMQFIAFPIPDRSVPSSRTAALDLAKRLQVALTDGKGVAVHCRQGIGRSAVIAACLLILSGTDVEQALQRVSAARGFTVPETAEQYQWIVEFARALSSQPTLQP